MTLPWDSLRSGIGARGSFEELCCQLARYEQVPEKSEFVRKGTPDAGVECYWKLPNSDEYAWQAKYFREPPNSQQWTQIDNSVKKAIKKHPNLKRYIVCLPLDMPDGRQTGQRSFFDKWNEHKSKWEDEKPGIEFKFWGNSEIEEKLSKEEHSGRCKYFFNKDFFSSQWFENELKVAIENAGTRYSPELNVELPIAQIFETLGRTKIFYNNLKSIAGKIIKEYRHATSSKLEKEINADHSLLKTSIDKISKILINIEKIEQPDLDLEAINKNIKICEQIIEEILSRIYEIKLQIEPTNTDPSGHNNEPRYKYSPYHFRNLQDLLSKLEAMSKSNSWLVTNTGALLLKGDAGTGKTHLFCDVAEKRVQNKQPTILIHGGHLKDGNPEQQILNELDVVGTFEDFLQSLESVAQARNCRVLFMIDALNEGDGMQIWPNHLSGLLGKFSRYSWIGVALSVRTTYEEDTIPSEISSDKLSKFTHGGFGDVQDDAMKIFFDNNGIQQPSVPLFIPEFSNPLFLKILCQGLRNKGLTKIPKGLNGITSVYEFFIDTINEKICKINYLDYHKHQKKVHKAIGTMVELFNTKDSSFVKYDEADNALQSIHLSTTKSKSLLHHLISEGILNEDVTTDESKERIQVVRFAYERLADNLLVSTILKNVKNKSQLPNLFNKKGKFTKYFESEYALNHYKGIVDAISIQIPEKFGIELIQIKSRSIHPVIIESFIDSFVWRHPSSIKKSTQTLVEKKIMNDGLYRNRLLQELLRISVEPQNRLNASYLNKYLKNMDLPTRDSLWSIFLHEKFLSENSIVKTCIRWARVGNNANLDLDSRYLLAILLSWFLTSSDRVLRDTATKSLVSLLFKHLDIVQKILREFNKCDDPYVVERLFAVAYGCVMKSDDKNQIKSLANETFSLIFKKGTPPLNLLLRDHAKNIIDYAVSKEIEIDIDHNKIQIPYKSDWIEYPTEKQIEKLRKKIESAPERARGGQSIFYSLGVMGDFYLYTIGGNSNYFDWSNVPLLKNGKSRGTIFKEFEDSITEKQEISWKNYYKITTEKDSLQRIKKEDRQHAFGFTFEDNEFDDVVKNYRDQFYELLTLRQKGIFSKDIESYLENCFTRNYTPEEFDLKQFANWIIKKVFDLGWSTEKFGSFDMYVEGQQGSRSTNKLERMGKKYQWIAFEELLARVSDNFEFLNEYGEQPFRSYEGTWQLWERDIDPSLIIHKTYRTRGSDQTSCWWIPFDYDAWETQSDLDWLKDSTDLPDFKSILQVINPKDESEWLVLQCHYDSQQPISAEKDEYNTPKRNIFFHIDSYLLEKSQTKKCYNWGMETNVL